jgi:hypothetical protein
MKPYLRILLLQGLIILACLALGFIIGRRASIRELGQGFSPSERLKRHLGLSDEQMVKLKPAFDQAQLEAQTLMNEISTRSVPIRERLHQAVRPHLTPTQQAELDAVRRAQDHLRDGLLGR